MTQYAGCEEAKREHSWYRWYWSRKNARYQRECSIMGCEAWQFLMGKLIAATPIVLTNEGLEHVHDWWYWGPVEEFQVKDNRFYSRVCRNCSATEETQDLVEVGETIFFPWQEAR